MHAIVFSFCINPARSVNHFDRSSSPHPIPGKSDSPRNMLRRRKIHLPVLSYWDLQLAFLVDFLSNTNKIVLGNLLKSTSKFFFINKTKKEQKGTCLCPQQHQSTQLIHNLIFWDRFSYIPGLLWTTWRNKKRYFALENNWTTKNQTISHKGCTQHDV